MNQYDKDNPPILLAANDEVTILDVRYRVETTYLQRISGDICECNAAIFEKLKLDPHSVASAAYGYPAGNGDWPEYRSRDYEAATVLVRMLLELSKRVGASEVPEEHREVFAALEAGDWGCQKESVYALVSALRGFEFKPR